MGTLDNRYKSLGWWSDERLIDRFERYVMADGEALAVIAGDIILSRGELWQLAGQMADELLAQGVQPGQVILIYLPNNAAWMIAFIASLRIGLIPATLPITTTIEHLEYIIDLTHPTLIVTCEHYRNDLSAEIATQASINAVGSPGVVVLDDEGASRWLLEPEQDAPLASIEGLAHMMFTSSTTGPPKAVMHTDNTLATLNRQFAERFLLDEHSPIFMASPLGHSVGAMHGARLSMWLGTQLVLQYSWDPQDALRLIEQYQAAFTAAATPFLVDLVDATWEQDTPKLASLRAFLCGGAQVPPELVQRARRELPNTFMTPLWGMTEGGLTTCLPSSPSEKVENTVGIGLPDLEVRILGADNNALGVDEVGELAMRGPGVFFGYFAKDELYESLLTEDGFFRTGDLASIDEDGYVSIRGRLKDLMIRGGVNISPVMTENTLMAHPQVRSVAVIGWPDDRLGERLCAVILTHGTAPSLDELIAFCSKQGLHRRFLPERLFVVDAFPRTAAGKIRKQQLKQELIAKAANS